MRHGCICLLAALSLSASSCLAEAPKYAPHYLSPDAINVVSLLPPPPMADSPEHEAEIEQLIKLQQTRTPAEIARVTEEEHHLSVFVFATVLGPNFNAQRCPKTAAFFKTAIQADLAYFNKKAKNHFNRPRPYTDPRVHALFLEHDGSYPSGHSIRGTLMGELLASVLPEHRDSLIARSQQIGWDREIAGVHFPTDIYAGRVMGQVLAHALMRNPELKKQLDAIKPEIEAALSAKTPESKSN